MDAKIALPDTLPVDEGELAIVVANALENAIHANQKLPPNRREIYCKMVGTPSVMLEISNPCSGSVSFDSKGLPLAQKDGHGLGVQSISAFCQKNGAVCHFNLTNGWFQLQGRINTDIPPPSYQVPFLPSMLFLLYSFGTEGRAFLLFHDKSPIDIQAKQAYN